MNVAIRVGTGRAVALADMDEVSSVVIGHRDAPGQIGTVNSLAVSAGARRLPETEGGARRSVHAEQFDLNISAGRGVARFRAAVVRCRGQRDENGIVRPVSAAIWVVGGAGVETEDPAAIRCIIRGGRRVL